MLGKSPRARLKTHGMSEVVVKDKMWCREHVSDSKKNRFFNNFLSKAVDNGRIMQTPAEPLHCDGQEMCTCSTREHAATASFRTVGVIRVCLGFKDS